MVSPNEKRIADTVIWFDKAEDRRPLVIEVQLSRQDNVDFAKRSEDYLTAGFDFMWLDFHLEPSECTNPLDPVSKSKLEDNNQYSIKGVYQLSRQKLKSFRWDGIKPIDNALRFPYRYDLKSYTFTVWYDHDWRDLALWTKDALHTSSAYRSRPVLRYLYLCAAQRCSHCRSSQRIWLSEKMCNDLDYNAWYELIQSTALMDSEKRTISDFMNQLD